MGPILGGSNIWIYMVILMESPYKSALFGLGLYNDPCLTPITGPFSNGEFSIFIRNRT